LPLTFYFIGLAYLNSRTRPTRFNGAWDFVGVLFALSGFLFLGGPILLSALDSTWRMLWMKGGLREFHEAWQPARIGWMSIWGGYFFLIVGGASLILWRRSRLTAIYQVEPHLIAETLQECIEMTRRTCRVEANSLHVGPKEAEPGCVVQVDIVETFCHATLTWNGATPATRREIELALDGGLYRIGVVSNPLANWLFSLAAILFFMMLFCLVFMGTILFS